MAGFSIFIAFLILLSGIFFFKKLWVGALVSILFLVIYKSILLSNCTHLIIPIFSGLIISIELVLLLFGANLFYNTLYSNNHYSKFINTTSFFSSRLIVLLVLCLFMGSFLEGVAGFGIPAMLIAPLMITLGFKPLTSIVLPLAANTTAVTFGALGTPFKLGLGIFEVDSTVTHTLILNSLPAFTLPFLLYFIYCKTEQIEIQWKKNISTLVGAGVSFLTPYLIAGLVSIEYPSMVAGFIGLLIFVTFFVPKKEKPPFMFWITLFYPYFILVFFLLNANYLLSDNHWKLLPGPRALSLYQPGIIFIITSIVYLIIIRKNKLVYHFLNQSKETLHKTWKTIFTLFLLVCMVQIIKDDLSNSINRYYTGLHEISKLFLTPFLGVAGSFISGSATLSNIMMGHAIKANELTASHLSILLALLHSGSAFGNAISLQNILMIKSVINQPLLGYDKPLKYNIPFVLFSIMTIILISLFLVKW